MSFCFRLSSQRQFFFSSLDVICFVFLSRSGLLLSRWRKVREKVKERAKENYHSSLSFEERQFAFWRTNLQLLLQPQQLNYIGQLKRWHFGRFKEREAKNSSTPLSENSLLLSSYFLLWNGLNYSEKTKTVRQRRRRLGRNLFYSVWCI